MEPLKSQPSPLSLWAQQRLQRRFALMAGSVLVMISGLLLILTVSFYRGDVLARQGEAAHQVAHLLRASLENTMLKRDLEGLQAIIDALGAQPNVAAVRVLSPTGQQRFSAPNGLPGGYLKDPDILKAITLQTQQVGFRDLGTQAPVPRVVRAITPVLNRPDCTGCHGAIADHPVNGLLVVDFDASDLRRQMIGGIGLLAGFGFVVIGTILGAAWLWLDRVVLARLRGLERASDRMSAGDLTARTGITGQDEIARVAQSFDDMGVRLEQSMDALRSSHAFLQALIDAVPDGLRVIGPDHRLLMVNHAYLAQIGSTQARELGRTCYASSHHRSAPCVATMVRCPVEELIAAGASDIKCSHTHKTVAGGDLRVEVSAARAVMRIDGEDVPCVIESIRDLNASVAISQEQRLAEMGMLAAGVAHEVFNPLSSIQLVLDALEDQPLDDQGRDYLRLARKEIATCLDVTDSLLRLTAAPDGDELVDLGAAMRETARLLQLSALQNGVEITIEHSGDTSVIGRDSDLRMLAFNLTQNALHAMPGGGRLTLSCMREGGQVVLRVADTGIGIAPADQERVMLPFWTRRADGSKGRGLGLSICRAIVDRLSGDIALESEPGRGSVFTVTLPGAGAENERQETSI
ncbi:MAG: hypothetical protein CSA65_05085 [Proteobacteria bacterium]|nr:MAG: hypothetical protein CSA65_05085 [Pseudomonadota bacterium]